jgi:hypothetical protein
MLARNTYRHLAVLAMLATTLDISQGWSANSLLHEQAGIQGKLINRLNFTFLEKVHRRV